MIEEELFHRALEKPTLAEQLAFLDQLCADQPELRQRVERLLRSHRHEDSFLHPGVTTDQSTTETTGTVIGSYKLLEQIGEGGMGTVWMAQQTEPVKRLVAVKLIKAGMDSKQIIARFEAERQALALMEHPNISRVLDAGTTNSGRPYFVIDLVKGVPITKYCDEHHLTPRQRLELFIPVCQAVQHAHQKGIIHRDLKPSNVLVALYDGRPVPKVIDFGVAKAAGQSLTDKTLVTGFGAIVGTLEYMSPEQAELNQLDIDTRSDIYSLGVVLYELLAGTTPLEHKRVKDTGLLEALRIIREEEVPTLSNRLSATAELPAVAANRGTEPAKLTKLLRGELDWIVMKALEKDRNRRYETANSFAMDVQRYLADEPVQACPPTVGYRLRKFARRNKGGLAVAALVLFFLVLLGGGVGWTVRDRAAREAEATRQQEERQAKVGGQVESILAEVDQLEKEQKWSEALAAARRAETLVTGAGGDATLKAKVQRVLGDQKLINRLELIRLDRDRPYKTEQFPAWANRAYSDAFREAGLDPDQLPPDVAFERLRERSAVALVLATALDDWALCRDKQQDSASAQTLRSLAQRLDPDPWRGQLRDAMARKDAHAIEALAASPDLTSQPPAALYLLFLAHYLVDKPEQAVTMLRKANRQYPNDFWITYWLSYRLRQLGPAYHDEATGFGRTAVALRPQSSWAWNILGNALENQGQRENALAAYRRTAELEPTSVWAHFDAGRMLEELDHRDEAIISYWKALECDPQHGPNRFRFLHAIRLQQERASTIAFFRNAVAATPNNALAHNALGQALWWEKKPEDSLTCFEKALALDPTYPDFHLSLANNLRRLGRVDEAIASYVKALELGVRDDWLHYEYGRALHQKGRIADAIQSWKTAIEINANEVRSHRALSWHLATAADPALRDPKEAVGHAQKTVDLDPDRPNHWSNLGVAQWRAGEFKAAIETLEKADAMYPDGDMFHRFFLAMAYWQNGDKDKAQSAYHQAVLWAEKNRPTSEELQRFRTEAETVLKIDTK